jgi:anhydro-N-acetylmuramic acid kinase
VPAFHAWLFHSPTKNRVVLNLGGIANITLIPADLALPVTGFDTGPANTLLDRWIEKHRGLNHDEDGAWGRSGTMQPDLLEQLLADDYFGLAPPKSTGRERFNLDWLEATLRVFGKLLPPADVQATLVELTVRSVLLALERFVTNVDEVFVCGGGVHNHYLLERLRAHTTIPVQGTERLGLAPDWVEACAFAWLAHQTLEGLPGNIPSVTGAKHPVVLGGIYKA